MDWFKGRILTGNHVVPFPWHIGLKASYWFLLSCCLRMIIVRCNVHHYICLWSLIIFENYYHEYYLSRVLLFHAYTIYVAYSQCGILIFYHRRRRRRHHHHHPHPHHHDNTHDINDYKNNDHSHNGRLLSSLSLLWSITGTVIKPPWNSHKMLAMCHCWQPLSWLS